MPTGMSTVWAKRDPEAAHAWSLANGKVGFEEWMICSNVFPSPGSRISESTAGGWKPRPSVR